MEIPVKRLRYQDVAIRQDGGYHGWPEGAPFDCILITAAPPEVPQALLDQLRPEGKLVAPVGDSIFSQELVIIDRLTDGSLRRRPVAPVVFMPMVHEKN